MNDDETNRDERVIARRTVLTRGAGALAAIAICGSVARPVYAKGKSAKEDFFFQDTPGDDGKNCAGCINFTPKSTGAYGKDSGDCALLEGDVCTHC